MRLKTTCSMLCVSLVSVLPLHAGDLVVQIKSIRSDEGRAYVAVHRKFPDIEFPDMKGSVASFNLTARKGTITVVLKDLPGGDYAVAAFHDENGNGERDRNVLGIPTEGYAFGNDATGRMGPPTFEDAAVTVGEEPATASASMNY